MIVAALAYYAETVNTLERCVSSLAETCSALVALEGRWDFPEVEGNEPVAQREALRRTAYAAGLTYEHATGQWASQVEKRSELMARAEQLGDWIFVIDADEWLEGSDPELFLEGLNETKLDVAKVMCRRYPTSPAGNVRPIRRIYRASCGVRVKVAHNGYYTADGRFLHGDPCYVTLEDAEDLSAHVTLGHDTSARDGARAKARKDFLYDRRKFRTESWVGAAIHA